MSDVSIEQLPQRTSVSPDDQIILKEAGTATPSRAPFRDTYFGRLVPVCCVFRFEDDGTGNNRAVLLDPVPAQNGHIPCNVSSVAVNATSVIVNFNQTFGYVGAVVAAPDDFLAGGFLIGVECTTSAATLTLKTIVGVAVNPLTNATIRGTGNAVWVLGQMHPA